MGSSRVRTSRDFVLTYGFYIVLALMFLVYSAIAPNFLTLGNLMALLHKASPLMITAAGVAFVIMSAKIDISLGSIAFFSAGLGTLLVVRQGWPLGIGLLIMLLAGALLGALNGVLIVLLKMNPLIVTLGMLFAYRGAALYVTDSAIIGMPEALRALGTATFGPVFVDTLIALAVLSLAHIVHTRTAFGRHVMAIGNSERIAAGLGVCVGLMSFVSFVLSGLLAAFGAIFTISQVGSVNPSLGSGLEFTAIAVIVIGGISLFGGEGRILPGLGLGVLTLVIIENGLNLLGTSPFAYPFVQGAVILVAMYADSLKAHVRTRPATADTELEVTAPASGH